MSVRLLYFARIRERIGIDGEVCEPPCDVITVADLLDWLCDRGPQYQNAFADRAKVRCALDQEMVPLSALIAATTEIALFPPVTGG